MNSEPSTEARADLNTPPGAVKIAQQSGLFKQLLCDDSGNVSSMRAVMLWAALLVLGTWSFICIRNGQLVDMPSEVSLLLFGLTGLKLTQRKIAETISGNDPLPPTTQPEK